MEQGTHNSLDVGSNPTRPTSPNIPVRGVAVWIVKLVKPPTVNTYHPDFFPRTFAYKKDAILLKQEVEKKGGEAVVEKRK